MFGDVSGERQAATNKVASFLAGIFYVAGLWMFIDGISYSDLYSHPVYFYEFIPTIISTIGMFLIVNLPASMFNSKDSWGAEEILWWHKALLVIGIFLLFGSLIEVIWVYAAVPIFRSADDIKYRGVTEIVQVGATFVSTFIWRFVWQQTDL